jgi:hypothetical protein
MGYLTTGKRSKLAAEYQAQVNQWARIAGVKPPIVRVRQKTGGTYHRKTMTMIVPPECHQDSLVHEFAHHLVAVDSGPQGHGPMFRLALVEAAVIAHGRANRYSWGSEYTNVMIWARKVGLGDRVRVRA